MDASINLPEVLRLHGMWLQGAPGGVRADLSGRDLSGAALQGADLRFADLRGVNLAGANLSYANLEGVDFSPLLRK